MKRKAILFWVLLGAAVGVWRGLTPRVEAARATASTVFLPAVLRNAPLHTVFGVQFGDVVPQQGLDRMAPIGLSWTRENGVAWSAVEPVYSGQGNWTALAAVEQDILAARKAGMETILVVGSTPAWAQQNPGVYCGPIAEDALDEFGTFLHALVARYSAPPFHIRYWEIWNEPDVAPASVPPAAQYGCWGNASDPYFGGGYYGQMLTVIYPQIKAASPAAQVLVGGLLLDCDPLNPPQEPPGLGRAWSRPSGNPKDCTSSKFLEGILRYPGAKDAFDGVSFHAYDYFYNGYGAYGNQNWNSGWFASGGDIPANVQSVLVAKVSYLRSVLAAYAAPEKYLMNTESALLCGGPVDPPGGPGCESDPSSSFELTKAYYIGPAYAAAMAAGLKANLWYTALGWRNSGLLDADLSPRPAFTAYKFARDTLQDAAYVRTLTEFTNVAGYEFQRDGRRYWILWTKNGDPQMITLPGVPSSAWDALGAPVSLSGSAANTNPLTAITMNPLYLEWNP